MKIESKGSLFGPGESVTEIAEKLNLNPDLVGALFETVLSGLLQIMDDPDKAPIFCGIVAENEAGEIEDEPVLGALLLLPDQAKRIDFDTDLGGLVAAICRGEVAIKGTPERA